MALDIIKIRSETPACENIIHFNNAGCSLMPASVTHALIEYLQQEQNLGGYETEQKRKDELETFYASAAHLINCDENEIACCESATRAWQNFFYSLKFMPGDNIITTRMDYGSSFVGYIQATRQHSVELQFVETDGNGNIDLSHLASLIDDRTKLISISHIPTGCGIVNDAEKVGEIASKSDIPYLLDACQSVGQLEMDVKKLKCTALSTTSRKYIRGPRGMGFLFVDKRFLENSEPVFLEQRGVTLLNDSSYKVVETAKRFENVENSKAGKLAMALSMAYANNIGLKHIEERIIRLAGYFRDKLNGIDKVNLHDIGTKQCGIVTFLIEGQHPADTKQMLSINNINTWVSVGPGSLIDFQARGLESVTRASLHYYNTEDEVDQFCDVISRIATT